MPTSIVSSFVVLGGEFAAVMFDERDFCNGFGPLERDQVKAGPIGRFSYLGGKYEFWVAPDRIDIRCRDQDVLPDALIAAAQRVVERLEPARPVISVSAIGMNYDVIFLAQEIGQEGHLWCRSLTNTSLSQSLFEEPFMSTATFSFQSGAVRYGVRLEPDNQSQGKNLVVAINAHQDVTATDMLGEKLQAVGEVREQVAKLHSRLSL